MMKPRFILTALFIGLGLSTTPHANAEAMLTLTAPSVQAKSSAADLTELLSLAVSHDANWKSTQFNAKAQQENYAIAKSQLLPQLQYSVQTAINEDKGTNFFGISGKYNSNSQSVRLSQPLFRLDTWFAAKRAKAQYNQVNAELESEYQNLIIKVATAYFDWLKAEAQLDFADAEQKAYQKQKEQAELRFKSGLTAITDAYEAQSEADLAYARQIIARNQLALAKKNMQAMTQVITSSVIAPTSTAPQQFTEKNLDHWIALAKKQNPDYLSAKLSLEAAKQAKKAQVSAFGPQVDLTGSYTDGKNSTPSAQASERKSSQISMQLTLPLWTSGQNSARYRQINNQLQAADAHLDAVASDTAVKISVLLDQLKADEDILAAQQQAKKSSQTAVIATRAGYGAGTRTIVELLQAQSKQLSSVKEYQTAWYDYLLHQLQFEQVTGSLSAASIAKLAEK